jgi:hypothetical protein
VAAKRSAPKKGTRTTSKGLTAKGLTAEEKAALRETIKERKAEQEGKNAEAAVKAKIASMREPDRSLGKAVHAIVTGAAPGLKPKLWYGMPAYANADGKIVCFFQDAAKFKSKYATFGFNHDNANLDEGNMWPNAFSLKKLTAAEEAKIAGLVKKAVS